MNKLISNICTFGVFWFCLSVAEAGTDQKADFSARLLFEQCIAAKGDATSIKAGNDFSLVPLPGPYAQLFLKGSPGKAWAALVPFGNFILTIHDDGVCSVHIRRVDSLAIKDEFLWTLNYIAGKTGQVEKIGEEQIKLQYGLLQQYSYKVVGKDGLGSYNALLTTTDSNEAPLQALMSVVPTQ